MARADALTREQAARPPLHWRERDAELEAQRQAEVDDRVCRRLAAAEAGVWLYEAHEHPRPVVVRKSSDGAVAALYEKFVAPAGEGSDG